jgi:hypothetical protein
MLQVRRIVYSMIEIQAELSARLGSKAPLTVTVEDPTSSTAPALRVPQPLAIDLIGDIWQLVHRLTHEYTKAKADVLRAHGHAVPPIRLPFVLDRDQAWIDAEKAFWHNAPYGSILLSQALRSAFLHALGIAAGSCPVDLQSLPTWELPAVATRAGLSLPFKAELLGGIAYYLESCQARCVVASVGVLHPVFLILKATVASLLALPHDPALALRARTVLSEMAPANEEAEAHAED